VALFDISSTGMRV